MKIFISFSEIKSLATKRQERLREYIESIKESSIQNVLNEKWDDDLPGTPPTKEKLEKRYDEIVEFLILHDLSTTLLASSFDDGYVELTEEESKLLKEKKPILMGEIVYYDFGIVAKPGYFYELERKFVFPNFALLDARRNLKKTKQTENKKKEEKDTNRNTLIFGLIFAVIFILPLILVYLKVI